MILVEKRVNSYHLEAQFDERQNRKLTDASLVNIEPKGKPLINFSFVSVHNDCSGSQPAACAIRAHMTHLSTNTTEANR